MIRRLLMTTMLVSAFAAPAMAKDFTKEEIEQIIHDYIMKNPQVMIDSVNNFESEKKSQAEEQYDAVIKANADWLYKNKNHAEAGNPKGDITIVEFFDYNCGYCKQALNDILTVLDEDKNIRLVFVEIPILGESSMEAARWAMAANEQKSYLEYHIALMRHKGPLDAATLEDYAKKVGLDVAKLQEDLKNPKVMDTLNDNLNMARTFGVNGTPAFIIGENIVRGYIGIDGLRKVIADTREGEKKE